MKASLVCILLVSLCSHRDVLAFVDVTTGKYRFDPSASVKILQTNVDLLIANPPGPQTITNSAKQAQVALDSSREALSAFTKQLAEGATASIGLQTAGFHLTLPPFLENSPVMALIKQDPWVLAPIAQIALVVAIAVVGIVGINNSNGGVPDGGSIYSTGRYNALEANTYYSNRPLLVAGRQFNIAAKSLGFGLSLLSDFLTNKLADPDQELLRAQELTGLLTELGPTFIKIGQSLSVRTDRKYTVNFIMMHCTPSHDLLSCLSTALASAQLLICFSRVLNKLF
jgi:hypothetical protein